jgi:hypothetical protein
VGKIIQFVLLFLMTINSFAQQMEVNAYFMRDSARLGESVGYVLKVIHPETSQVIFPDSTFDYSPFILLENKPLFPPQQKVQQSIVRSIFFLIFT